MAATIVIGNKVYNNTLQCIATILSPIRPDGTVHIETPYGNIYCYTSDLEDLDDGR